jgi:xanthosine phosphorylase
MATKLEEVMAVVRKYAPDFHAKYGMILGSGLSSLADQITDQITIPYQAMGFTSAGVQGHASLLILGKLNDVPVICLKGRMHFYEGVPYETIATLVRIVKSLGGSHLIITGASGSLNRDIGPGEIAAISDHINLMPGNPLAGPNDESIGPRFTSMENAYDFGMRELLFRSANKMNIDLWEGVYLSTMGPSFETPAEIKAFRTLGADFVGMSVVPEVIVARHCGLKVLGIAAVSNFAVGMTNDRVTHEGTLQFAEVGARKLTKLIPDFIKTLSTEFAT